MLGHTTVEQQLLQEEEFTVVTTKRTKRSVNNTKNNKNCSSRNTAGNNHGDNVKKRDKSSSNGTDAVEEKRRHKRNNNHAPLNKREHSERTNVPHKKTNHSYRTGRENVRHNKATHLGNVMKLPSDPAQLESYLRLLSSVIEYECTLLNSQHEHEQDFNFQEQKILRNIKNRLMHVYDAASLKQQNKKDIDVCISRSQIFAEKSLTNEEKIVIARIQDKYQSVFEMDGTEEARDFNMYRDAHLLFFDLIILFKETLYEDGHDFIDCNNMNTEHTKQLLQLCKFPDDWRVIFANSSDENMREKWREVNFNKMVEQQLNEAKFILTWNKFLEEKKIEDISESDPKAMLKKLNMQEYTSSFERMQFFKEHIIDRYHLSGEEVNIGPVEQVEQEIWERYLKEQVKVLTLPKEDYEQEQLLRQNDPYADRFLAEHELTIVKNKIKFEMLGKMDREDYNLITNKDIEALKKKHPNINEFFKNSKKSFDGYLNNIGHLFNFLRNLLTFFPCATDTPWSEKLSYTQFVLQSLPQLLNLVPFFEKRMYFWRRTQRDMKYTLPIAIYSLKCVYLNEDTLLQMAEDLENDIQANLQNNEDATMLKVEPIESVSQLVSDDIPALTKNEHVVCSTSAQEETKSEHRVTPTDSATPTALKWDSSYILIMVAFVVAIIAFIIFLITK